MLERIHGGLEKVSRAAAWAGGGALMLAAIMVTLDVISRKVFSVTMSGSDEISGYVFAGSTAWAYSYCLLHRANVRIDALYNRLSMKTRAFLDLLGVVLLLIYVGLLAAKAVEVFQFTVKFNTTAQTTLATPLWIPQMFWVSGLVFFFLSLCFVTLYTIVGLLRRDWALVARIAGVRSVEEEIEEETVGTDVRVVRHGEGV